MYLGVFPPKIGIAQFSNPNINVNIFSVTWNYHNLFFVGYLGCPEFSMIYHYQYYTKKYTNTFPLAEDTMFLRSWWPHSCLQGERSVRHVTQVFVICVFLNQAQLSQAITGSIFALNYTEQVFGWGLRFLGTHVVINRKYIHVILTRQEKYLFMYPWTNPLTPANRLSVTWGQAHAYFVSHYIFSI